MEASSPSRTRPARSGSGGGSRWPRNLSLLEVAPFLGRKALTLATFESTDTFRSAGTRRNRRWNDECPGLERHLVLEAGGSRGPVPPRGGSVLGLPARPAPGIPPPG